MTKHTITIEIDIPDEMLAHVHDVAHNSIYMLREDFCRKAENYHGAATLFERDEDKEMIEQSIKSLATATNVVSSAMSEITQTMNAANSEWLKSRTTTSTGA